jgi:hypothetical protein
VWLPAADNAAAAEDSSRQEVAMADHDPLLVATAQTLRALLFVLKDR